MNMFLYKTICLCVFIFSAINISFAQLDEWKIDHGKATRERSFSLEGRSSTDVYKEIQRWLIKYYKDPEEIIKARIDGEYLRGVGYHADFLKSREFSQADLQYTFTVELTQQEVVFKIADILLVHDAWQDVGAAYRLEDFFEQAKKKRKNPEAERVITELTNFSNSLFQSFESVVFTSLTKL
ncbi:hypothetical protein [Chryseolinea sp. H1M3-3]|uniref:hypothetical protein n=1 Tax=Chryseolinea sp. H1M3-3 TaxID=3034144 RepID=UPI0023ECE21B|nr:hypothetical protein [Chryseolinea sp. H1M3-3]